MNFKGIKVYCSVVRSLLGYGTVLWNSNHFGLIIKLEKIKKKCLRFYAYKTKCPHSTDNIGKFEGLKSLKSRRIMFDVTFIHKILNGVIDCLELLRKNGLKVSYFGQM